MADRGIIFSAPMVRALIERRKTQTRRLATSPLRRCEVGDRLWVRETAWICPPRWTDSPANPMGPLNQEVAYKADDRSGYTAEAARDYKLKLRPSIHMPRWASRLTLIVEAVRVEPLQAISETDARSEGLSFDAGLYHVDHDHHAVSPITAYMALWETLHGPGSWAANPQVVALTFRVVKANIDRMPERAAA